MRVAAETSKASAILTTFAPSPSAMVPDAVSISATVSSPVPPVTFWAALPRVMLLVSLSKTSVSMVAERV